MFMEGHNPRTDQFFGDPQEKDDPWVIANKTGYVGEKGSQIGAEGVNQQGYDGWSPTGEGYDIQNGFKQAGTSAFDKDVNRARQMGQAGQGRQAVQLDRGASSGSRMMQMGALGLMRRGAEGGMPSRAVVQGQQAGQAQVRGGTAAMAGGGLRNFNAVARGTGEQMSTVGAGVADARAGEVARDTRGLVQGGLQMRTGDIDEATAQAKLDAHQRALNEQRQQQFERRAWDTRNQQQRAAVDAEKIRRGEQLEWDRQEDAWDQAERERFQNGMSMGLGAGSSALSLMFASDSRAKTRVGSLSTLRSKHMKGY